MSPVPQHEREASPQDQQHLARALELARSVAGLASPNPTVGCVLVSGDTVLGEGAHVYDRRDHAEIAALKQAAALYQAVPLTGATAYVSLEPCAHHGRTGPCADALIAAGIRRCVVAIVDPNPLVRGAGLAKLRAAGVEVVLLDPASPPAQYARRLNDAFAFSVVQHRPFVTLKAAVSVDGKIAPPRVHQSLREPFWLTGPAARADVQQLRHAADAILTGIGTVLADDPSLTDRTGLPRRRPLLRVVLDSDLRLPLDAKLAGTRADDVLLLASTEASLERESLLRERGVAIARLPASPPGHLQLAAALRVLHERDIRSVLLEGGSAINGAFLRAGLVDRVVLYFAEVELGVDALPFAEGEPSPYKLLERLTSVSHAEFPHATQSPLQDVRIAGYLHDPWAGTAS